jgi:hypothetical protein
VRIPKADGSLYRAPSDFNLEESLLLGDILSTAIFASCQVKFFILKTLHRY